MNTATQIAAGSESINSICGVLVHTRQQDLASVEKQLAELEGVEVHATTDEGRMIVTIEGERAGQVGETLMQIQHIRGVVSASLVYQFTDESEDVTEEVSQ